MIEKRIPPLYDQRDTRSTPCAMRLYEGDQSDLKEVILSAMVDHRDRLLSAERIIIVGCGTSWHAGLIGKQ